ncbi:MAG: hypothetical protein A2270_02300 [Elusimicrobia bacterium RIFOXYA12_FULL_51_18]|nr:MAG: hypothetical protein A2270_02300 [Elusimicrobia bacterium RIFOXYA12_FULL_51_18]OGS30121.1 MAG: hypothetical protein A2218_01855 [Elusimicrobia bacterium RIFOXYA2_FULL_53_38]
MKAFLKISAVCSVSLYANAAGAPLPSAIKAPIPKAAVTPGEKIRSSVVSDPGIPKAEEAVIGHTAFDEFSNVNDPLYREGSKVLLQKAIEKDISSEAEVKDTPVNKKRLMRDAPADIPAKAAQPGHEQRVNENKRPVILPAKKNRLIKLVPADPIQNKSTL